MKLWNSPMHRSPRCGAKTRSGAPCLAPAVHGKKRCRMHGGNSPGAPKGNQYALKHGRYSRVAIEKRRETRNIVINLRQTIAMARLKGVTR